MLEVHSNVFVGDVSSMVRDKLWDLAVSKVRAGNCALLFNAQNEQGFTIRLHGPARRRPEDFEGLTLIREP